MTGDVNRGSARRQPIGFFFAEKEEHGRCQRVFGMSCYPWWLFCFTAVCICNSLAFALRASR